MLAAKTLLEQNIEVVGLTFISNFFGATKGLAAAKQLGIPLIAYNFAPQHLEMVKAPKYGHGKNMNPCIDCHSMMLREAMEILAGKEMVLFYPDGSIKAMTEPFDFIATGEVLGQRPMSQNKQALDTVAEYSGAQEKLLRPLSAKLLEETEMEKGGLVDREKLLDISGRARTRQVELAKQYGITDYPSPAGGCLLTDPEFSNRLKEMFENWPNCVGEDVEILKHGRVHWLTVGNEKLLLMVGRHAEDNARLEKLYRPNDVQIALYEQKGPVAILRAKVSLATIKGRELEIDVPLELDKKPLTFGSTEELLNEVLRLVGYYAVKARGQRVKMNAK